MLTEFKTFIAVAQYGTFSGAGRVLGLTQSAVSAQIKRLERFLGMPLFDRSAKSAVLNSHGHDVLVQAREIVAMVDRLRAPHLPGAVSGTVRLGAIASVQQHLLGHALTRFHAHYPDVRVRIVPGVSLALLGQVDAGEVDLGVMIRPPFALPPELTWIALSNEPMMLAVPAEVSGEDWRSLLGQHPFIRYERASFGGRAVDLFLRRQRISVRDFIELDEIDAMVNMVRSGLGVALVPRTANMDLAGIRLVPLGAHAFMREIGIVGRLPLDPGSLAGTLAECFLRAAEQAVMPVRSEP